MARARATAAGIAAGVAAGLVGVAAAGARVALRRPLPQTTGQLVVPGLNAPVEVLRDRWGVPHIYAASNADLFFAQGFVHAQDRLWQLELHRRTGHGRLAEIFGARALESDRFLRVLGFGRVARQEAEALEGTTREALEGYVSGVNAFLGQAGGRLPVEFTLLRFRPEPWRLDDVLVWGKIMALNLSGNWTAEVLAAHIVAAVGPDRAAALLPSYPAAHPLTLPPALGADALAGAEAARPFTGQGDGTQGSNAWVVSGARSKSGKPLLANDPHLALQMPSLWYEMHLTGGDYAVAGASIPGSPGIVIGHNARIAWGVTNGMNDVQDLYVEHFDPADPTGRRYEFQGAWENATVVREEIVVRAGRRTCTETLDVRLTRHGPIVSPLVPQADATPGEQLALRWTALEPDQLPRAVLALNRAADWASFRAALADWTVPTQNFVYADIDGHIGYALGGVIPLRAQGDGQLPAPGWTGEWEWTGTIPAKENPHVLDPGAGLIVTANNRIAGDDYRYPLPAEWLPGYRAARIGALLERTARHDADSFARIQADRRSLPGEVFVALAATGGLPATGDPVAQAASATLAAWDSVVSADSVGALIYVALREQLLARVYREIAPQLGLVTGLGVFATLPGNMFLLRAMPEVLRRLAAHDDSWLPDGATWDAVLRDAWGAAITHLRAEQGDDIARWRYGRANLLTLRHPLGALRPLDRLFNRGPFATGGDSNTVCMGSRSVDPNGLETFVAPSYRQIWDLADWDRGRTMHPTGQSGHPASPHYDDFIASWRSGKYHPTPWTPAAVEAATAARLTLTPASARQ
ncbi:MAG: penicillin acylase family protein [Thermomicrobiales bacterium]